MNDALLQELIENTEVLEPETLRQIFPELTEEEFNTTMALKLLKHTRHFWENFYAFEDMVLALNGVVPDFGNLEGCTPEQIWYAVQLAEKIRPEMEYAKEIQLYVKAMSNEAGVFVYPPELNMNNPYYEVAHNLAEHGPFPLGENSIEEIQAGKLLGIYEYLKEQK